MCILRVRELVHVRRKMRERSAGMVGRWQRSALATDVGDSSIGNHLIPEEER